MIIGYYPGWDRGFVLDYIDELKADGQRKKAAAKLEFDLQMLVTTWPRPQFVTVKPITGHKLLWELIREFQSIAYRIFFCVKGQEIWLLHAIEKKKNKTPADALALADVRMQNVFNGKVRR